MGALGASSGRGFGHYGGQPLGHRNHLRLVLSFDHDANDRFGSGGPQNHASRIGELVLGHGHGVPDFGHLRRIEATYHEVAALPVTVEIGRHGLLDDSLSWRGADRPEVHSAWICPEIPSVFEWGHLPEAPLRRSAPAPG